MGAGYLWYISPNIDAVPDLANLNLRGNFKAQIMEYIAEQYPRLLSLYQDIYNRSRRAYWEWLAGEMRNFAQAAGLEYVTNDDTLKRPFGAPPVVVNYFYHSEIKKNAMR